ncbi:MAG: SDR family oxidoreductase [Betaproteobacteria bacterium]|nr:SDR family oxidoreductase [Betaproteobacteria bacterium]NBT69014.1 SDR family oxidoreductase [Betaproteobacteria bacterium]
MSENWSGCSAVVTGGARGQGASVAGMLAQAGAHVYVMDYFGDSKRDFSELKQTCASYLGQLTCLELDVAQESSWQQVANQIKKDGSPLKALVNNAGITGARNTVTKTPLKDWNRIIDVNLTGAFLGIQMLAPMMIATGSIVNISSTVGMTGYYSAAYSTTKWALRGLTKSAAMELAPKGIRVNCICPGVVDTEMIRNFPALVKALEKIVPMQAMAQPEQIAQVMFFLLSQQANYITGADIPVDGGVTGGGIFWPVGREIGAL